MGGLLIATCEGEAGLSRCLQCAVPAAACDARGEAARRTSAR
jgi:hypothetical protein